MEQMILTEDIGTKPKPAWLAIRPPTGQFSVVKDIIKKHRLHTVCEEAHCPNMAECWSQGTATFMVLGSVCTRGCKFCAVTTGNPKGKLDAEEPSKLGECVREMNLNYVVITSVDRDDLPDQGAAHFAECVLEIKKQSPKTIVEVLTPDFRGEEECIETIAKAEPDVFGHNVETVERLQLKARDGRASYEQSLKVLEHVKKLYPGIYTKSGMMLGLGETESEVVETMQDLREIGVSIFTMGQYLRPSSWHLAVEEWVHPEKFGRLGKTGERLGFDYVAAGPFVRSSYRAGELFMESIIKKTQDNLGVV